jgi:magnesium-transporting ATPase (P-type)
LKSLKAVAFYLSTSASVGILLFLSNCLALPPTLSSAQLVWINFVLGPAIAFSLINAPQDPNIMKLMPGKSSLLIDATKMNTFNNV